MRGDSDTLPLIQKIPSGDALGASDSCMHTLNFTHIQIHITILLHNAEATKI